VTNKWRNIEAVRRVRPGLPLLLMASEQVRGVCAWSLWCGRRSRWLGGARGPAAANQPMPGVALQDEIVPFSQMEAIRKAAGSRPGLVWQVR